MSLTSSGVRFGSASSIKATTPEAIGVAMLVPDLVSYPVSAKLTPAPGIGNEVAYVAEVMFDP